MALPLHAILGQDHAVETLRRVLASGRLPHAWIFSGPRGVGKFTTAVAFARILLDPDARIGADPAAPDLLEAAPDGLVSRRLRAGTHPDLHVVRKELALHSDNPQLRTRKLSNIPLDVLRERMIGGKTGDDRHHEALAYRTAALGHGKVFIIDEAELIDRYGQNALLKTLEEPPAATYVILVSSRAERLLPTIRSRCQHVRFGPLDPAAMAAWLARADLDVDDAERDWIARFADGSPGTALVAAQYAFFAWQARLAPMLADLEDGAFPVEMGATLAELVEEFASAWVKENANASKDAANKDGAGYVLALLGAHAREHVRSRCADEEAVAPWLDVVDLLRATERDLAANVNLKQALENLVAQWARVFRSSVAA